MSRKGEHYEAMKRNLALKMWGYVEGFAHATRQSEEKAELDVIAAMKEVLAQMEGKAQKKKRRLFQR
jgi:Holliday junction resolvase